MPNEPTSRWARPTRNVRDAYPKDLAALVAERWEDRSGASDPPERGYFHPLPEASVLEGVLSACYQASLLREEESPVIFRLALCGPEAFPDKGGPLTGCNASSSRNLAPSMPKSYVGSLRPPTFRAR